MYQPQDGQGKCMLCAGWSRKPGDEQCHATDAWESTPIVAPAATNLVEEAPLQKKAPTKGFCYNGDCSYELIAKTMGGGYFKADAASNKYVSAACSESSTTSCVNPDFAAAP